MDIYRDWGWAPDYVEAMWEMLQLPAPDDFVIATGEQHSLQDFVTVTFEQLGLNWRDHVKSDQSLLRPSDIERCCGNASKAKEILGWKAKHRFDDIISMLIEGEQQRVSS